MKVGRNDPCTCGSGKKFKQCCERARAQRQRRGDSLARGVLLLLGPLGIAFLIAASVSALRDPSADGEARRVWSAAHNHWHLVGPDGTEIEARPGVAWSEEQGTFVNVQPITEAARKHVTHDLDERLVTASEQAANDSEESVDVQP
jgi:hypothetical protein